MPHLDCLLRWSVAVDVAAGERSWVSQVDRGRSGGDSVPRRGNVERERAAAHEINVRGTSSRGVVALITGPSWFAQRRRPNWPRAGRILDSGHWSSTPSCRQHSPSHTQMWSTVRAAQPKQDAPVQKRAAPLVLLRGQPRILSDHCDGKVCLPGADGGAHIVERRGGRRGVRSSRLPRRGPLLPAAATASHLDAPVSRVAVRGRDVCRKVHGAD